MLYIKKHQSGCKQNVNICKQGTGKNLNISINNIYYQICVMGYVLSYRPTPEEQVILDENRVIWRDFCKKNINNLRRNSWGEILDKMTYAMLAIIAGGIIFSVSFFLPNLMLLIVYWVISGILITVGGVRAMLLYLERNKIRKGL